MKKKLKLCCLTLVTSLNLCAALFGASGEQKNFRPAGTRKTAQNEKMRSQTERSLFSLIYPDASSEEQEVDYFIKAELFSKEEVYAAVEAVEKQSGGAEEIHEKSSLSNTTHLGAYHYPRYITPFGDSIVLEDGSRWAVCSHDQGCILGWYTNDALVITPNHDWFSSHDYRVNNLMTGHSIRVNLIEAPHYNGLFTHWIVAIDYLHKKICLEDGSVWSISVWDDAELKRMVLEDTIIIGTNDSWFKSSRPNILINVDTMEYIKARCDY